jgi:hypothetical protein
MRYAVAGKLNARAEADGLPIHYVAANPGSYVYPTSARPDLAPPASLSASNYCDNRTLIATSGRMLFDEPDASAVLNCPEYNSWKWGLHNLPLYMNESVSFYQQRLPKVNIHFLLGGADTCDNKFESLDTCWDHDLRSGFLLTTLITLITLSP